jgi:hypothetical protein
MSLPAPDGAPKGTPCPVAHDVRLGVRAITSRPDDALDQLVG